MRIIFCCVLWLATAPLISALAQSAPRAGVYRTPSDYWHHHLAPAGEDVRYSPKHNRFVVSTRRAGTVMKTNIARDSVWGYLDDKSHLYRVLGGDDYRVEQADTITVYSRNSTKTGTQQITSGGDGINSSMYTATHYYFSRGINGRIFPLIDKYLRAAYEAGSPAFVAKLANRPYGKELSAYDKKAGTFYIVSLFRSTGGK